MNIKAVLIDIDDTILDFDRCADEASRMCADKHNITLPENYYDVFLQVNDKLWGLLEQGEIEKKDIYERRWSEILRIFEINADGKAFDDDFRSIIRDIAIPVDGAEELLLYLSKKYPVYCASNASRERQEHRLKINGWDKYISGLFISEDIGFQKPAKEFFYACFEALYPITPDEIIMIGDSVTADITGAKNFGFRSVWFNKKGKAYDNYDFTDFTVNHLSEIKKIL